MLFRPMRSARLDDLFIVSVRLRSNFWQPSAAQFRRVEADPPPSIARLGAIALEAPCLCALRPE